MVIDIVSLQSMLVLETDVSIDLFVLVNIMSKNERSFYVQFQHKYIQSDIYHHFYDK